LITLFLVPAFYLILSDGLLDVAPESPPEPEVAAATALGTG
jgi:hypothetical protein